MLIFSSFLSCKIPSSRNKSAYGLVGKGHCIAAATQHRSKHQILTADKNTILLMASRPIYVPITPESVLPLEARSFEKKQIFQEEQKTIFAIIKPVLGIFF